MKILINDDGRKKVKRIFSTTKITAGIHTPKAGIFWLIDSELVVICTEVTIHGSDDVDILHVNAWKDLKNRYKVEGKVVKYDYFPRGRVMVVPIMNHSGEFDYYECCIYGDNCIINDAQIREQIESEFRLYLKTCKVSYEGQLSIDGTHYTCHNCREA